MKSFIETKTEIITKETEANIPKFKGGSLTEIQIMLKDIYNKLNEFNERINILELK